MDIQFLILFELNIIINKKKMILELKEMFFL